MKVRSSLVLSVGDDLDRLGCQIQDAVHRRWPMLAPVVAFVNIRPDGTVVRRRDGEAQVVGKLPGLADGGNLASGTESGAWKSNYAALAGDQAGFMPTLRRIAADVRSQQKLVRLQREHGWEDSGGLFVQVLADSFGPLASVLPLALHEAISERRGRLGSGFEPLLSVFYFLPGLFLSTETVEGRRTMARALARSHATLSEMESALYPDKADKQTVPCRVWVAGSVDRQGAVTNFESVQTPAAHFLARMVDGCLGDDRVWDNALGSVVDQRRTLLSTFGYADLYFPRSFLNGFALASSRRRLQIHMSGRDEPDSEALSVEVQGWIGKAGIDGVLGRLTSSKEGKLVLRPASQAPGAAVAQEPDQPVVEPDELVADDYLRAVAREVEAGGQWGVLVRSAGDRLFDGCLKEFRDELSRRLDSQSGGLAAGGVFCAHLAGTGRGLTEALVGADVRNLNSLAFDVQYRLAREAGMPGDAERLKQLKVALIPGKEGAVSSTQQRIKAESAVLARLAKGPSQDGQDGRTDEIKSRIAALQGDVEKYLEELAALRAECAEQEVKVDEQRRMARDPSRRHLLLARLREAEADDLEKDERRLRDAVARRTQAGDRYDRAGRERKQTMREVFLHAAGAAGLFLVAYVLLVVTTPLDFAFAVAWKVLLAGMAAVVIIRGTRAYKLVAEERNARGALAEAREAVVNAARRLWAREVNALRRRFTFLVHAEAIRVLDRLRDEVAAEEARIKELQGRVAQYGKSVDEEEAALARIAPDQDAGYHRESVLTRRQAEAMIGDSKALDQDVREAIESVTRSALLQEIRAGGSTADWGPTVRTAEASLRRAVDNFLGNENVATVLDRFLANEDQGEVRLLWHGVQQAARAQLGLHLDGDQGVVRQLFLVPPDLSSVLKTFLEQHVVASGSVDWATAGRDYVGVCKTIMAFPTCQVAELTIDKSDLDAHWEDVCVRRGVPLLSLPAHEAVARVKDEDAVVVLQAATAFLDGEARQRGGAIRSLVRSRISSPKASRTPREWLDLFEHAEEFPTETVEEMAEKLRARCRSSSQDADNLGRFKDGIPPLYRHRLDFLMRR